MDRFSTFYLFSGLMQEERERPSWHESLEQVFCVISYPCTLLGCEQEEMSIRVHWAAGR